MVDAFNAAPISYPAETEREENMHKSFGSLVGSIMIVFEKYGIKEYSAEIGEKLDSYLHEIDHVVIGESDGVIHEMLRPGHMDSEGDVIRRALVVAVKKEDPQVESAGEEEHGNDGEEKAEGDTELEEGVV